MKIQKTSASSVSNSRTASSSNSGSQTSTQQSITQGRVGSKDPVGVWKDKAAAIVFTLNADGSAMVKYYQGGTSPSYHTTWREKDANKYGTILEGTNTLGGIEGAKGTFYNFQRNLYKRAF